MKTQIKVTSGFTRTELLVMLAVIVILCVMFIPPMIKMKSRSARLTCDNNLKQLGVAFRLTRQDIAFSGAIFMTTNALERTPNLADLCATADGQASPYTYQVFGLMSNELNTPKLLVCPLDERRFHTNFNVTLNNSGNDPKHLVNQYVSYFVGKEIDEASSRMLEFGDRNIGTSASGPNSAFGFSKAPNDNSGYTKVFGTNALNGTVQWTRKMHNQSGNILFADGHVEKLDPKMLRKAFENSGDRYGTATGGNFLLFP